MASADRRCSKLIKGQLTLESGEIAASTSARMATVDRGHPATPVSLIDTILAADAGHVV